MLIFGVLALVGCPSRQQLQLQRRRSCWAAAPAVIIRCELCSLTRFCRRCVSACSGCDIDMSLLVLMVAAPVVVVHTRRCKLCCTDRCCWQRVSASVTATVRATIGSEAEASRNIYISGSRN